MAYFIRQHIHGGATCWSPINMRLFLKGPFTDECDTQQYQQAHGYSEITARFGAAINKSKHLKRLNKFIYPHISFGWVEEYVQLHSQIQQLWPECLLLHLGKSQAPRQAVVQCKHLSPKSKDHKWLQIYVQKNPRDRHTHTSSPQMHSASLPTAKCFTV